MNNYQNGGWYNNPATGKNQQYWNGQWYDTPQQGNPSVANPYQSSLDSLNKGTNDYYNQQQGFSQQQHDINSNLYNTLNTQALGTQDQAAKDAFLNSVYTPEMKQQGSLQYGYNMNLGNENAMYGLQNTANSQNRQLALAKLATDEQNSLADLGLRHGNQNASTIDSLNSRGMLYGQQPTGMYQDQNIGGLHGLAGQQAGLVNTDFANQRNQIVQPYGENVLGTNQQYNQLQAQQDQTHNYNVQNLGYSAANSVNNQNANYLHDTSLNNNQLAMAQANLKQQQFQDQQRNKLSAQTITGSNYQ